MAPWIIPALKAVLPHIGKIISAASPVFTKKSADTAANQAALLQRQIGELQAAVAQNTGNIKELAGQLQTTLAALGQAAAMAEASLRRTRLLSIAAVALSALALCAAFWMLLAR